MNIDELIEFRKFLHRNAELSGKEYNTAEIIKKKLSETGPDEIITGIGGTGLAAVYEGAGAGKTVMFRAELDALPIIENNDFEHRSLNDAVSHKCGHDGHMTILAGLAGRVKEHLERLSGRVVLLFQPAEETAAGAKAVVNDPKFISIKPDYIFALHNLPAFPKGEIIIRQGTFAAASKGMIVKLSGETSHAAYPERGVNPSLAMARLMQGLVAIPGAFTSLNNAGKITVIHAKLGEIAFGTSPGEAVVMATFRAHRDEDMNIMTEKALKLIEALCLADGLNYDVSWVEDFPASVNDDECVERIAKSASKIGAVCTVREEPFPWSEDFAYFTQKYKGSIFGLGSGIDSKPLHNSQYDFPDEIINPGIEMFENILIDILEYSEKKT